eukprot:3846127-Rhodomonas_salina.5
MVYGRPKSNTRNPLVLYDLGMLVVFFSDCGLHCLDKRGTGLSFGVCGTDIQRAVPVLCSAMSGTQSDLQHTGTVSSSARATPCPVLTERTLRPATRRSYGST